MAIMLLNYSWTRFGLASEIGFETNGRHRCRPYRIMCPSKRIFRRIFMELKNVRALVTGGASGLGEATARRLLAGGGRVVLADLNEEKGNALVAELGENAVLVKT